MEKFKAEQEAKAKAKAEAEAQMAKTYDDDEDENDLLDSLLNTLDDADRERERQEESANSTPPGQAGDELDSLLDDIHPDEASTAVHDVDADDVDIAAIANEALAASTSNASDADALLEEVRAERNREDEAERETLQREANTTIDGLMHDAYAEKKAAEEEARRKKLAHEVYILLSSFSFQASTFPYFKIAICNSWLPIQMPIIQIKLHYQDNRNLKLRQQQLAMLLINCWCLVMTMNMLKKLKLQTKTFSYCLMKKLNFFLVLGILFKFNFLFIFFLKPINSYIIFSFIFSFFQFRFVCWFVLFFVCQDSECLEMLIKAFITTKPIVLKKLRQQAFHTEFLDYLKTNVRELCQISHEHLLRPIGVVLEVDICVVWPFEPAGNLLSLIDSETEPLEAPTRVRMAREIAQALHCLHSNK